MGSKSKSSTAQTITDASANAGTNSIAASGGATVTGSGSIYATTGANVSIETLNDDVALAFMQNLKDTQALTYRENSDVRAAANIANETNAALAGQLASLAVNNVAESKRDPDNQLLSTLAKYGAWLVGAIAALALLFFASRPRTK